MGKPHYLIDFENVQPRALDRLTPGSARILVFLGQQQTRLMLDLVQVLQPFGADAEYIAINGTGPDAVDFHLAYYMGRISVQEPGATFRIISRDKGFDPLVRHLNARGFDCQRLAEIPASKVPPSAAPAPAPAPPAAKKVAKASAPAPKKAAKTAKKAAAKNVVVTIEPMRSTTVTSKPTSAAARAKVVLGYLAKSTKPGKVGGLRASIKSWFKPALDEKAVDALLQSLQSSKKIAIAGDKVTYTL